MSGSPYWQGEWPNLPSITITLPIDRTWSLSAEEIGALYRIVHFIATRSVHTAYSVADNDPRAPNDDAKLARIANLPPKQWQRVRPEIERFFAISNDGWRTVEEGMVVLVRPRLRQPIPTQTASLVRARVGERCAYCGATDGTFHFDHLFPVAHGGTNQPSNLVVACQSCNLAKGSKTLREWMEGRS